MAYRTQPITTDTTAYRNDWYNNTGNPMDPTRPVSETPVGYGARREELMNTANQTRTPISGLPPKTQSFLGQPGVDVNYPYSKQNISGVPRPPVAPIAPAAPTPQTRPLVNPTFPRPGVNPGGQTMPPQAGGNQNPQPWQQENPPTYDDWIKTQQKYFPRVMVPDPRGTGEQVDYAYAEYLKATGQVQPNIDNRQMNLLVKLLMQIFRGGNQK